MGEGHIVTSSTAFVDGPDQVHAISAGNDVVLVADLGSVLHRVAFHIRTVDGWEAFRKVVDELERLWDEALTRRIRDVFETVEKATMTLATDPTYRDAYVGLEDVIRGGEDIDLHVREAIEEIDELRAAEYERQNSPEALAEARRDREYHRAKEENL